MIKYENILNCQSDLQALVTNFNKMNENWYKIEDLNHQFES